MMETILRHTDLIAICSVSYVCSYTMGSLISFFRRPELDTDSQLESIEKELKMFSEKRLLHTKAREDLYTKTRMYGFSVFVVLLAGLYLTFPSEFIKQSILIIFVFIIYPVAVLLNRKFWKFYHDRKKDEAQKQIEVLQKRRVDILESVMEKEPYNKAREILKKYAPNLIREEKKAPIVMARKKLVDGKPILNKTVNHSPPAVQHLERKLSTTLPAEPPFSPIMRAPVSSPLQRRRPNTVRPLPDRLNQSRVDKIVGWVVGSNPEQMYALICKSCCSHNGLALKEEFDYLEWRCAYCHLLNQARKDRPRPPRLAAQKPMDIPRSRSTSTERRHPVGPSNRSSSVEPVLQSRLEEDSVNPGLPTPSAELRHPTESENKKKDEDSGTESDQMEKQEDATLDETILAHGPGEADVIVETISEDESEDNLANVTAENDSTAMNSLVEPTVNEQSEL